MDVNSEEVSYKMMVLSLEKTLQEMSNIIEAQKNLLSKAFNVITTNTEELIRYQEKYGKL